MHWTTWTRPAIAALLLCLATAESGEAQEREPYPNLDAYVDTALQAWGVPGLALAIVRNDSVIYARGYGVRTIGGDRPVDAHTVFAVGSTSKAFTTAALAVLVDEGKVQWDDPVTRHLPGFQMFDPVITRELTIRDLVTHRSGLARGDLVWSAYDYDREEVVRRVRFLEPAWSFRSQFGYQNLMYITAGQVIAHTSQSTWDDFLYERIINPLGMSNTSTSIASLDGLSNVASPHSLVDDELVAVPWSNVDNVGAAGSMNSSALDMARWLRMQLADGEFEGARIVSAEVSEEIRTPQTVVRLEGPWRMRSPDAHLLTYGLGWFLQDHHGRLLVQHSGNVNAMSAVVGFLPDENMGVVVLTNAAGTLLPNAIMYRILDHHLNAPLKDWSGIMLQGTHESRERAREADVRRAASRVPGTHPSLPLDAYAGVFAERLHGEAHVIEDEETLRLRIGSRYDGILEHWHFDTFRAVWNQSHLAPSVVTFALDSRGEVRWMNIELGGGIQFERDLHAAGEPTVGRGGSGGEWYDDEELSVWLVDPLGSPRKDAAPRTNEATMENKCRHPSNC